MYSGKLISVGEIIWKVLRNPIAADLTYDQAAEFTIEFIRLLNAPLAFIDKVTDPPIQIESFKVRIPDDLIDVKGIRYIEDLNKNNAVAMRYATDIYHLNEDESTECTYMLQNCIITASKEKGYLQISYKAIATDDEGYPMIPDNESFKKGLEYYILSCYMEPLWAMGKIQDKVFQYYSQERYFYTGQAESSLKLQGVDQLESVMNSINRLIHTTSAHTNGFKNIGQKEIIRRFN
jgi:hypothetical protein